MANRFDYKGGEHESWLASRTEDIIEAQLPIVDAHHHLWIRGEAPYLLREFADDMSTGHHIVASVFAECHSMYRRHGPEAEQPLGEMEFVAGIAAMSDAGAFDTQGVCRAAVGSVDLTLGDGIRPILENMDAVSGGRFRGVRASTCWHTDDRLHNAGPFEGYLLDDRVLAGIRALADLGYSLDVWCYHTQLPEVLAVADAAPDLTIIINHTGTPILGGPYRDQLDQVKDDWRQSMQALAARPNTFIKLGALPAKFDVTDAGPPTSEQIAAAWGPWIEPCIEWFGPERSLFESNFPVHKNWMSYTSLWNAFKRIASGASPTEKANLFSGAAMRAYRFALPDDNH